MSKSSKSKQNQSKWRTSQNCQISKICSISGLPSWNKRLLKFGWRSYHSWICNRRPLFNFPDLPKCSHKFVRSTMFGITVIIAHSQFCTKRWRRSLVLTRNRLTGRMKQRKTICIWLHLRPSFHQWMKIKKKATNFSEKMSMMRP